MSRAGISGPVVFVGGTLGHVLVQPGHDPVRQLVSELALAPTGWFQNAVFVVSGALIVVFALGRPSGWGRRWVALTGTALIAAGLFVIDGPGVVTWHGMLHQVAGPLVFAGLAATAFTYRGRAGIVAGILVVVFFLASAVSLAVAWGTGPAGLFESLSLCAGLGFLITLAVRR